MTPLYISMKISAPERLASLRRSFATWFARNPHAPRDRVTSWRDVRFATFKTEIGLSQGLNTRCILDTANSGGSDIKIPVWYCDRGAQFRDEQYADEIENSPIGHTGWFSDACQDDKLRGIVARLPHGRFISGCEWSFDGQRVYFADVFDDIREAARNADREAEIYAESEREYSERCNEAQTLSDATETALQRLRECLALRHRECMAYMHGEITQLIETIRGNRERLAGELREYI